MMEEETENEDFYTLLNIAPEATEAEIKTAHKQLCILFHPDKHSSNPELKESAQTMFSKVQSAYEVLSDPEKRALYDAYGVKGLQTGLDIVKYCTTREEILAECKAQERIRKELEKTAIANAVSFMGARIDARSILEPDGFSNMDISEMWLRQSIQTEFSQRDTMLLGGALLVDRGRGFGSGSTTFRHKLGHGRWWEAEARLGSKQELTMRYQTEVAPGLDGNASVSVDTGADLSVNGSLVRNLGHGFRGLLDFSAQQQSQAMKSGIFFETNHLWASAVVQFALPDSNIEITAESPITEDLKIKGGLKIGLVTGSINIGAEKTIVDNDNRIGANLELNMLEGVFVEFQYTRMSQTYSIPVHVADEIIPATVLIAAVAPVLAYFALKQLCIDPYLRREEAREKSEARRRSRRVVERDRSDALAAVQLMKETVGRRIEEEDSVNGLVIMQAFYGQLISNEFDDDDDDDFPRLTEVTVPLQCLVIKSALRLQKSSKAGLPGFYDPTPDEPKSLRVRYRFMGAVHEVTVKDDQGLTIPLKKHKLVVPQ